MIEDMYVSRRFLAFNHRSLSLTLFPRTVPGASALAFSLLACAWALPRIPFGAPNIAQAPVVATAPKAAANTAVANPFGAVLVDLRARARSASAALARRARMVAENVPAESLPAAKSLPAAESLPAAPAARARVADIPPLPPRRAEELKQGAAASGDIRVASGRSLIREYALAAAPFGGIRIRPGSGGGQRAAGAVRVQLGENAPESLPVPPRRPDELSANQNPHELNQNAPPVRLSAREAARQRRNARTVVAAAPPPADNRGFLEKLFGGAPQTSSPALGYAPAEGGVTTAARSVMSSVQPDRSATINTPPSTTSPRIRSICRMASVWRRIRASATGSTIRARWLRKCAAPRRRPFTR